MGLMSQKICKVDGCDCKHLAKGYCQKHYAQIRRYGHVLERTRFDANEIVGYEDFAEIVLYNKQDKEIARAIIDLEDIEKCKDYKWRINDKGYIITDIKGEQGKKLRLHRFLMDCPDDMVVDHINHDRFDNRKSNLRICTQQQNSWNKKCIGVFFDNSKNRWCARININGKSKHLGYFKTKEEAIKARKQAEINYFGEYAPNED
jgi:hypothetical protein